MRQAGSLLALAAVLASCGGDDAAPTGDIVGAFRIEVQGHSVTDTAGAILTQPLTVHVRDAAGRPVPDVPIRFEATPGEAPYAHTAYLSGAANQVSYSGFWAEPTSVQGLVAVVVRLGLEAGAAAVVLTAPTLGWRDTAGYTVTPAALAQVIIEPASRP